MFEMGPVGLVETQLFCFTPKTVIFLYNLYIGYNMVV